MRITRRLSSLIGLICAFLLFLLSLDGTAQEKQAQTQKQKDAKQKTQTVTEVQWPREFKNKDGAKLVMYAPQIESWEEFSKLQARVAMAFAKNAKESPQLGSFLLSADTEADHETRLVKFKNLKASEVKFPSLKPEVTEKITMEIEKVVPKDDLLISLDRVLTNLERSSVQMNEVNVKNDPPRIFVNFKPAVLVLTDGKPIWSPIKDNDLKWAVNTNWDLFSHEKSGKFFLLKQNSWLESTSLNGPWTPAFQLPDSFSKLPKDDPNWEEVRKNLPGKRLKPEEVPHVYYTEEPAELIYIKGETKLEIIPG